MTDVTLIRRQEKLFKSWINSVRKAIADLAVAIAGGTYTVVETTLYKTRYAYDLSGNIEYIGKAAPGTAEGTEEWQIQKWAWSAGKLQSIDFAGGDGAFAYSWTARLSYAYS